MIEVSISFTSPETRAIISPLPLFREKAQREFRYLAVDAVADVADDTRTDQDHRIKSHIHRPDLQESRHDQENTQYDQREGTAFRLDHVGHEPKEVVFQQFRSRFPGFRTRKGRTSNPYRYRFRH